VPRTGRTGFRRAGLTGRAAVLALVLCALVVMLADPLQTYLRQRSQIADQRSANAALQHRVDALDALQRLWSDPAYVKQQARKRLYFVMPGETPYVVVGDTPAKKPTKPVTAGNAKQPTEGTAHGAAGKAATPVDPVPVGTGAAWYARLWSTVQISGERSIAAAPARPADRPAKPANPAPIKPTGGG
jgi:cell division protein FtsB